MKNRKRYCHREGEDKASEAKSKKNATTEVLSADGDSKDENDDESTSKEDYEAKLKEMNKKRTHRDDVTDTVKLGDEGWKKRYYTQKFGDELYEEDFTKRLWGEYTRGLCWVLAYYYKGCASWSWYYPFHYAPFASDLKDLEQYAPVMFDKSKTVFSHNAAYGCTSPAK